MSNINSEQLTLPNIGPEIKELRLSVSKVKTFTACRKQFYFLYIVKIARREFEFHRLGKCIHLILELFHSDVINGSIDPLNKIMRNAYQTAMNTYSSQMSEESKKVVYSMADFYLKEITNNKDKLKSVIAVEKNFNINIGNNVILNGMIDRVQIDPDGVFHICDYKTTKDRKYLVNDYLQLLTYAYVMLSENPNIEKVRGSYILLRHNNELITKEFNLKDILEIENQFKDYAKQIADENLYPASPSRLCAYCSALDQCPEGKSYIKPNVSFGPSNW